MKVLIILQKKEPKAFTLKSSLKYFDKYTYANIYIYYTKKIIKILYKNKVYLYTYTVECQ